MHELQASKNLDLLYWKYGQFDIDNMEIAECISEFRFEREDIFVLKDVLQISDQITCYNGTSASSIEAICIFLKRYAYSCRYLDMTSRF